MKTIFIEEVNEDKNWNQFLFHNNGGFLQSFEWGEFQKSLSKKVWRLEIRDESCILAQFQVIKEVLPLKSYFYLPFGPVLKKEISLEETKEILNLIFKKFQDIAKKEKAIFLRIEPIFTLPQNLNFQISPKRIQPQLTLILDLENPETEIFRNFHPKTRYNIKLAEKKGVKIRSMKVENQETKESKDYLEIFYKLLQKTAQRNKFYSYPKDYYEKMLKCQGENFKSELFLAEYKDKIIAGNIVIFFGKRATYLHGASNYNYRSLMASYLLQWQQILEAKTRKCEEYDFWGIDKKKWPGLTRFKKNFGGREIKYPAGIDLMFQKNWYKIYTIARKII